MTIRELKKVEVTMDEKDKTYRVIIAGSRDFTDYEQLKVQCNRLLSEKDVAHRIVILSGMARGTDSLAVRYAHEKDYALEEYPAHWETGGKRAGVIRNAEMAATADALIAFWDGNSKGTYDMITKARKKGLAVRVIRIKC